MARAGRKGHEVEAVLVHPRTLHWVPAPSRGCRCPVGDEGEWGAAGVPSDEQGKIFFFFLKRVQITPEYHTPVLVAPNPVSSHDGGPQPSHTSPRRAGAPQLSLWPGELVTVPGLCTAGSVLYSPDNCNPNSHSSVLVICREIIYAL